MLESRFKYIYKIQYHETTIKDILLFQSFYYA
jgi:hypothetical protein